ncbi:hypothetical protein CSC70_03815 [Pseudoxanthomonas kalamensis DSM 18571]|uniref:hypothetical protein n=1 Tax=Pseudoxanthomonas kalamensis TaxID=289483 RepID=UPI001390FBD2|nr:hypothetical protein [Pseudoxanthomonas kalamensis]KAF1711064.1 hypothetical protein CSC70_03815 [Pseudoxanthomonas kalamensis DSM 18571]
MAFDYPASAATAAALLDTFGQTVTLSRVVPGGYDPATGTVSPDTVQSQTCKAAILPYRDGDYLDGTVKAGDRKALIEPNLSWAPDATTKLTEVSGSVWQLEAVTEVAPAGVPVLYKANATR